MPSKSACLFPAVLVASVLGFAVSSASAQSYNPYANESAYSDGPNESVTVMAPRFRADTTPLNGPMERVSLSLPVHYTTRDLVNPGRARALRWRVWRAAQDVCGRLADAYPVYTSTSAPPCMREAYNDAMVKIDARITGARLAYWYGY